MRQFAIALLALTLSACGFTPLYASDATTGNIQIGAINGRAGLSLRKALMLELAPGLPGVEQSGRLEVTIKESIDRLGLRSDESATRTDIIVRANYVFAYDGTAVSGRSSAEASFLVSDAPFSDIASQVDATDRAMLLLARRITDDLRIKTASAE